MRRGRKIIVIPKNCLYQGDLILVNAEHPYRRAGMPELVGVGPEAYLTVVAGAQPGAEAPALSGQLLERRVVRALDGLMREIDGWEQIAAVSGWRPRSEQEALFAQSLRDNGEEYTRKFVAIPGCSEHETGLAIDLGIRKEQIDLICPDFPYTGIGEAFRKRAASYGFVERYPREKSTVTGIGAEPWHFRYVGTPHAEIMTREGLVLEEYIEFLKDYRYGGDPLTYEGEEEGWDISFLEAEAGADTCMEELGGLSCSVSGNNTDGFIITQRRCRVGRDKTDWWT